MNGEKEEPIAIELTQSQYIVGWVCALTEELAAATAMLDNVHLIPIDLNLPSTDDNVYFFGSVGKHNVVVTGLPKGKIGTVSAAVTARTLVGSFPSIKFGFMIGIGGGVPSEDHDIRLGDVVVSSPVRNFPGVVQWDLGKAMDGGTLERTGALNSPPRALLAALTHLESTHEREDSSIPGYLEDLKAKAQKLMRSYGKPDILSDILFSADSPHRNNGSGRGRPGCEACDAAKIIQREDRDEPVTIHYGLIASGNQVIKDADLRDRLNAEFGGQVLCVEMEAAGLMESFPCIVIRGICDYADSHKNKKWQKYAALVAAAYAKELLMVGSQHKAILDWLTPVSYDSQQHSIFNRRQQGTCQWFLQSKEFRQFLQKDSRIMFCEGFPGTGKTILASIVVNYLQHDLGSPPEEKVGLAFVFGDFLQRSHQRPVDILASLTKQLLRDQAYVPQEITETYNKSREISAPSRSHNDNPTFSKMLQQVIISLFTRVFIVIDALDELDEAPSVLREVFNFLEGTSASLFVTSRPNEKIQRMIKCDFEDNSPFKIRAQAEDIELYMDERLSHLKLFSHEVTDYSQETKSQLKIEIKRKVSEVVDGIFLLAKFHIDALEGQTTPRKIREKLETLYQGPDAYAQAYKKTIDRINSQRPELRLLAKRALQ
ncbi:purine and uridine phosphorylase, partial [Trichoderma longibrachiatum ATCC 18648]